MMKLFQSDFFFLLSSVMFCLPCWLCGFFCSFIIAFICLFVCFVCVIFYLVGCLFCVVFVWFGLFLPFFCSRNWPRGSSGGSYCGRRSQCHLHCSGVPARHSSCSRCDMRWQWPSIWHPCLWSQIFWRRRVSHCIAYVLSLSTGSIPWWSRAQEMINSTVQKQHLSHMAISIIDMVFRTKQNKP